MIYGTGVDLTTISRIRRAHERFGERFARRFLHAEEWLQYTRHNRPERFLAKRFAVKEAAVKALGTGERQGVLLSDFYVIHDALGRPELHADGEAACLCRRHGIDALHVSLSDEGDTVAAFVILECR
ncbi:MAG: holo-ACP synthase [Gammaproteobacteria bacterium]|nr:MAG: holo-ACP synthase [Gammaproteobacteria bacterium]